MTRQEAMDIIAIYSGLDLSKDPSGDILYKLAINVIKEKK